MPYNSTATDGVWAVDFDSTYPLAAAAIAKGYDSWVEDGLEFVQAALDNHPELSVDEVLDLINEGSTWVRIRRATPEETEAAWTG